MSDIRDYLPPEVRARIEELEAQGVSLEEQAARSDPDLREPPRAVAPTIATDEVEGLFGTTEDPQDGRIHYLLPPRDREDDIE